MSSTYMTTLLELIEKSEKLAVQNNVNTNPKAVYVEIGSHYLVGEGEDLDTRRANSGNLSESTKK